MSLVNPPNIVSPFGFNATDPDTIVDIPYESQAGILVGAASYEDGFPLATMVDPETEGGIPPFGQEVNGILNAITAHTAWVAGGLRYQFNGSLPALRGGYSQGAKVLSATDPHEYFESLTDNNINNPNIVPANWIGMCPVGAASTDYQTNAPIAGTHPDFAVAAGVAFLDIDTTAGDITITGFAVAFNGQFLTITNTGPNLLTIAANSGASTPNNRVRLPADLTVTQNGGITIRRCNAISRWTQA